MPEHLDENGFVRDTMTDREAAALAIVDCELCDDEGVRGMHRCDHVDYREAAKRGSALVRAELDKIRERKVKPA